MPPLKMFLLLGAAKMLNSWDTLVTKLDSYYIKKKPGILLTIDLV